MFGNGPGWDAAQATRLNEKQHRKARTAFSRDIWNRQGRTLRNLARDVLRNTPEAARAHDFLAAKLLGAEGIRPAWNTPDKELNKALDKAFDRWSNAVTPNGEESWVAVQRLEVREDFVGESFVQHGIVKDGLGTHLVLEPFEPEQLEMSTGGAGFNSTTAFFHDGIVYDAAGRKQKYIVTKVQPGFTFSTSTVEIPAENVAHIYEWKRPSQYRGETILDCLVRNFHDIGQIDYAAINLLENANTLGVWFETQPGLAPSDFRTIGLPPTPGSLAERMGGFVTEIGMVSGGPEKPHIISAPIPQFEYQEFRKGILKIGSARMNVPYSVISGDHSDSSYSAERSADATCRPVWISAQQRIVRKGVRPHVAAFERWVVLSGQVRLPARMSLADLEGYRRYRVPGFSSMDPKTDILLTEHALKTGKLSWTQFIEADGGDPRRQAEILKDSEDLADEFDLELPRPGYVPDMTPSEANGTPDPKTEETPAPAKKMKKAA